MRSLILAVAGFGSCLVTACSSNGTSVEFVSKSAVASVVLTLPSPSLMAGQTQRATATPRDAAGSPLPDRPVTWQTANPTIASVDNTGLIVAVAAGTNVITATSEGVSANGTLTVTAPPPVPVASVSVSLAAPTLQVGSTLQLTAVTRDGSSNVLSGRVVTWASANSGIASVNSSGVITAVAVGTTDIAATSEGVSGHSTVTVTAVAPVPVASVSVSPATPSLQVGATAQLSAVTRDANNNILSGRVVTWTSASPGMASVSSNGLVTAVAAGTADIAATSEGVVGHSTVTVTAVPPVPVASVSVSPSAPSVQIGASVQLSAVARDASGNILTGRAIVWASSVPGFATVSASGLVRGVAVGVTTITATSGSASGTSSVTIVAPPPPPPPPPGGSPEPVAGDVILWQDNFDGADIATLLSPYATNGAGITRVAPGRDGTGSSIRFTYRPADDDQLIEKGFAETTDIYFRYYFRVTPAGALPYDGITGSGLKWFMAWRPSSPTIGRYTESIGDLSGGPVPFTSQAWGFSSHDLSSTLQPSPFNQNIVQTPRFNTVNDGNWHKFTLHIVTGTGGYERIWVDDVLVLDSSGYGYDHNAQGINLVQFPGLVRDGIPDAAHIFSIDIDDFVVWHK
jgi:uncharacterized protein YjdB